MWREFTREKPARRGWALGLSVVVFAATMALAWGLTTGRISTSRTGVIGDFEGWPIRFALPTGYGLRSASSIPAEGDARGPGGVARYDANDQEGRRSVTVAFYQWPANLNWPELQRRLEIEGADGVDDVTLGRLDWRLFETSRIFSGIIEITAVHDQPNGLIVVVHSNVKAHETRAYVDLLAVCRSVKFK